MSYRELIAEQALLNALERGVLGDDTPEPPTLERDTKAAIQRECLNGCGPIDYGEWCPRCEQDGYR